MDDRGWNRAAVLIPVFSKSGAYHILYIRRSEKVAYHKGQISFPGGGYSITDKDLVETALRENWEEIGVRREDVKVLGELDDAKTETSNFIITPFVGLIPYPYVFKANTFELDEIFDVPISALMDETSFRQEDWGDGINKGTAYFYDYNGRVIWGATAAITRQFLEIFKRCNGTHGQRIL